MNSWRSAINFLVVRNSPNNGAVVSSSQRTHNTFCRFFNCRPSGIVDQNSKNSHFTCYLFENHGDNFSSKRTLQSCTSIYDRVIEERLGVITLSNFISSNLSYSTYIEELVHDDNNTNSPDHTRGVKDSTDKEQSTDFETKSKHSFSEAPKSSKSEDALSQMEAIHEKVSAILINYAGAELLAESTNNLTEAKELLIISAREYGYPPALYNLGVLYEAEGNDSKALKYYKKAAKAGHPLAEFNCGVFYSTKVAKKNLKLAKQYLYSAALKGVPEALKLFPSLKIPSDKSISDVYKFPVGG